MGFEKHPIPSSLIITSLFLFLPSVAYSLSRYSSAPAAAAASRPAAPRSVEQPLPVRHEQPCLLLLSSARCCPPPPSQHSRRHLLLRCCTSAPSHPLSLFPRSQRSAAAVTVQRCCSHPTPAPLLLFCSWAANSSLLFVAIRSLHDNSPPLPSPISLSNPNQENLQINNSSPTSQLPNSTTQFLIPVTHLFQIRIRKKSPNQQLLSHFSTPQIDNLISNSRHSSLPSLF